MHVCTQTTCQYMCIHIHHKGHGSARMRIMTLCLGKKRTHARMHKHTQTQTQTHTHTHTHTMRNRCITSIRRRGVRKPWSKSSTSRSSFLMTHSSHSVRQIDVRILKAFFWNQLLLSKIKSSPEMRPISETYILSLSLSLSLMHACIHTYIHTYAYINTFTYMRQCWLSYSCDRNALCDTKITCY
jgi:hypothetical protein